MKKLSMMLAAMALVAVGCDPYDDAPGGDPQIVQVTAAGRLVSAVVAEPPGAGGFWLLDDGAPLDVDENGFIEDSEFAAVEDLGVPAGAGGNNVIVITTNKLLDGSTIQAAPQDPADASSAGDCRPAGTTPWLTIRKTPAGGAQTTEALNYADTADPTASNYQWYTCYYPGAATSSYGSSIEIFRARANTPPGLTTATRPLTIAALEPDMTYEITGTVNDDSGNPLQINVHVRTVPVPEE
jgi:hypothetical protein